MSSTINDVKMTGVAASRNNLSGPYADNALIRFFPPLKSSETPLPSNVTYNKSSKVRDALHIVNPHGRPTHFSAEHVVPASAVVRTSRSVDPGVVGHLPIFFQLHADHRNHISTSEQSQQSATAAENLERRGFESTDVYNRDVRTALTTPDAENGQASIAYQLNTLGYGNQFAHLADPGRTEAEKATVRKSFNHMVMGDAPIPVIPRSTATAPVAATSVRLGNDGKMEAMAAYAIAQNQGKLYVSAEEKAHLSQLVNYFTNSSGSRSIAAPPNTGKKQSGTNRFAPY
jgi:hypothetical protein